MDKDMHVSLHPPRKVVTDTGTYIVYTPQYVFHLHPRATPYIIHRRKTYTLDNIFKLRVDHTLRVHPINTRRIVGFGTS